MYNYARILHSVSRVLEICEYSDQLKNTHFQECIKSLLIIVWQRKSQGHHNYVALRKNATERQRSARNLRAKQAEFLGVHKISTHNCIEKTNPGALKLCGIRRSAIYIYTYIYILEVLRASLSVYRFGRCFGVVIVPVIYMKPFLHQLHVFNFSPAWVYYLQTFIFTPNRKNNDKNEFIDQKNI